jgi:hypothetical protein
MPNSKEPSERDATKKALKFLFEHLKIEKVISIDDNNFSLPSFDNFSAICVMLNNEQRRHIPELEEIHFEDSDIFQTQLEKLWSKLEETAKEHLYEKLHNEFNKTNDPEISSTEPKDMNILDDILSEHNLEKLSLRAWRARKDQLLEESKIHRTLFLFDQNFKNEGGTDDAGIQSIKDIFMSRPPETLDSNALFGLLSHTFTPGDEHKRWEELAKEHNIDKNYFILISKQHLQETPLGFARMIKLAALNNDCNTLKEQAANIFENAHLNAKAEIEKINIYDFEHIVFQSSAREGVWEPDTLFRLFGLFYRDKAREKARLDNDLRTTTNRIRSVSAIPTDYSGLPEHSSWKFQQLEFYDDKVNDLYMPIELGDIFEATSGTTTKSYILIAQPCDLMVRKDGLRHRDVNEAIFAEIVSDVGQNGEKKELHSESHFELPYFSINHKFEHSTKYFVSFRKKYTVKLPIIDLCSYKSDGEAIICLDNWSEEMIIPPWKKRFDDVLLKLAKDIIDQYKEVNNLVQDLAPQNQKKILELAQQKLLLLPLITVYKKDKFKEKPLFDGEIDLNQACLVYKLRRIKRLSQPHSAAMLSKFSRYTAREAFEHDFGKEDNDYSSQSENNSEAG